MNSTRPPQTLAGLAKRLIEESILSSSDAMSIQQLADKNQESFISQLVTSQRIDDAVLTVIMSSEFGIPTIDLSAFDSRQLTINLVDEKLLKKHNALPLYKRGNKLFIAIADPTRIDDAMEDIRFNTGLSVEFVLVESKKLYRALEQYLEEQDETFSQLESDSLEDIELVDESHSDSSDDADASDDAPIVRFVHKIMMDAIKLKASDIHFEPYDQDYRVRYRVDGVLSEITKPPSNATNRLAARLKVMARLDISERRVPQDGRIKLRVSSSRSIDFRISCLPTLWGEKIVLRLLDSASAQLGVDILGFEPEQKLLFEQALSNPQGMILTTGPTGSGKTVTLYTGLNLLNTNDRNISTAEDPVEIQMHGINQVNVNYKVGLDFATALRAFLRQDPDIVMVGEIRDLETAEIAIKAAQTGHLVLSTLHTNSAAETLTRLRNMGVPSFNISTSVSLIIAQRLARRLCPECKTPLDIPKSSLQELGFDLTQGEPTVYQATGCEQCHQGYKGRVGIYEVVPITESISRIIMDNGNSLDIEKQACLEGYSNLRKSALKKVAEGITSLEEINRVIKV